MNRLVPRFLIVCMTFIFFLSSCRKKEFDEFYGRPDNLAAPVYQQLHERANFTKFLACVDQAGYKETLSAAGSWTVFAPTDEAFTSYMAENNLTEISTDLASSIVRYSMTYDGEKMERLSDNLTAKGFVRNVGFRRRTVYYDFVYDGFDNDHKAIKVIASNRNGAYLATDFNNKYISYFLSPFMTFNGIGAGDYTYFFPASTFTNKNVGAATITEEDIVAENGVIHIVDKVLSPPLSIDQYINAKSQYSAFKGLLDKYVTYSLNTDITHRYQLLTGKGDNVYVKTYSTLLAYAPNNENYLKADANDAQSGMYSIFAPTDQAVEAFAKVLLKYYGKVLKPGNYKDQLSELYSLRPDIIRDFINSHLFVNVVWPGKFTVTTNYLGEATTLSLPDVADKQLLSNGSLYGVNTAQNASVFSTVYGKINLDPTYKIMKQALDFFGLSGSPKTASLKYVIIPIPDATLVSMGYSYDPFYPTAPIRGDVVILKRILQSHIIPLGNRPVPNFAGAAGILETSNGEYIKYNKGQLSSVGTEDNLSATDKTIQVDSITTAVNGSVVYQSKALTYTVLPVSKHIEKYGTLSTDPYYSFFQFLKNNLPLYTASTGAIQGVLDGTSYTVLIPTNTAIQAAVTAGLLPKLASGLPNYTPSDAAEISKVTKFIQYHIINKSTVVSDGQKTGQFETLFKNESGDAAKIIVNTNTTGSLILQDVTGSTASVLLGTSDRSNVLSNRTVIHQINTYLKYQF